MKHIRRIEPEPAAHRRRMHAAVTAAILVVLLMPYVFRLSRIYGDAPEDMWAYGVEVRTYTRDKGGFGSDFSISLYKNGDFLYSEGCLSSHIGTGTWTRDGNAIRLDENFADGDTRHYYFTFVSGALVLDTFVPAHFAHLYVSGGERFSLTYAGAAPE